MSNIQRDIFKKSSRTFYYSSLFFPKSIQDDVHKLYAFVRTADDFVDATPQQWDQFHDFKKKSLYFIDTPEKKSEDRVIAGFVEVYKKYNFQREWVVSFLDAMQSDLEKVFVKNQEELEVYMYGSAAVVWYMMCAIFWIRDTENLLAAKNFAYSLQCINFIRDIDEDANLWRRYLFNYHISYQWNIKNDRNLWEFLKFHLGLYFSYLSQAQKWLKSLPISMRIAVLTASDVYNWTARKIQRRPEIVFEKKVKPTKFQVLLYWLKNAITLAIKYIFSTISYSGKS